MDEGYCNCTACGAETTVAIDPSQGRDQVQIIECETCHTPVTVNIHFEDSGDVLVMVDRCSPSLAALDLVLSN